MKKLYNGKGRRRVHPAPPTPPAPAWNQLAALPAAVLTLAAALTAEEQEVLAYLLSGCNGGGGKWREQPRLLRSHPPELGCRCFGCYKSFWARWDASPNRQVIHNIIEAVEESVELSERAQGSCRRRRRSGRGGRKGAVLAAATVAEEEGSFEAEKKGSLDTGNVADNDGDDEVDSRDDDDSGEDEGEKMNGGSNANQTSSMSRLVSFIGERVWRVVWN